MRRTRNAASAALAVVALLLGCGAPASESTAGADDTLRVEDLAVVAPPGGHGAVYFRVVNPSDAPDRLVAIELPGGAASLHRTTIEDGRASMDEVPEGFPVPAGGELLLEPGAAHGMLENLETTPAIGSRLALGLRFERSGRIDVEAPVVAYVGAGESDGEGGHGDHEGH